MKQAKEKHRRFLLRFSLACSHHLYHLLPEQDEAVVDDFVIVVMSKQPVVELGPFFDFLQEAGQVVVNISTVSQYVHDAVWGAVCDHIVHLIVNAFQAVPSFLILGFIGKLLFPPGVVVDPESGAHSAKGPVLFFVIGCFGVQNTVLDIMASGTAHGEEGIPLQIKDLPAHQMDHMRTDSLDLSAVPFLCGVFSQQVEVFMVAADEQRGKGQVLQPVQIPLLLLAPIPYAAKIPVVLNSG